MGKTFDGGDLLLGDVTDTSDARAAGLAIDEDRTRAALALAAAVFASRQIEMVAQHEQQAGIGIHIGGIDATVDI